MLEMQAVIHADPFARAKPDETVAVLADTPDGVVREAGIRIITLEAIVAGCSRQGR